jgi:prepilin-type processing-associated H-X9-DG protein
MTNKRPNRKAAFTRIELLVVVVTVAVLIAVLLPVLAVNKKKSSRLGCTNNLKQIGLAFSQWSLDNDGKFPTQVSATNGGTMELVESGNVFVHFRVLSNELTTPKLVFCPNESDPRRRMATSLDAADPKQVTPFIPLTSDQSVSYFVGVDAQNRYPQMLLSGDRNLEIDGVAAKPGIVALRSNNFIGWTRELHKRRGNVLFADGSVQATTKLRFSLSPEKTSVVTNRLAIP